MDKKKIVLTIITVILLIITIILVFIVVNRYMLQKSLQSSVDEFASKNQSTIFKIDEIVLFSSCDAKNKTGSITNYTVENLYQYTDIAFFISSTSQEKNAENTFKKVSINNIQFNEAPTSGAPNLYFKSINNFSKGEIIDENLITDNFEFDVTSKDEADLNKPILYNNLANPITLSYINTNIKPDYTITNTANPITYDGSLLKRCNIPLNEIAAKLSFDVNIVNNKDEEFKCSVFINIPLESDDKSIYDGSLTLREKTNYTFYRYK